MDIEDFGADWVGAKVAPIVVKSDKGIRTKSEILLGEVFQYRIESGPRSCKPRSP